MRGSSASSSARLAGAARHARRLRRADLRAPYYMLQTVPRGFIPTLDQGYAIVVVQLPDGASLSRTDAVMQQASRDHRRRRRASTNAVAFAGFSGATFTNASNAGVIFAALRRRSRSGSRQGQSADADHRHAVRHACRASRRPSSSRCRRRRSAASAMPAASRCSSRSATAPTCGRSWRSPTRSPARPTRRRA